MDTINIKRLLGNFRKRNFDAFYFHDKAGALEYLISEFKVGKTITWGGSLTINEIGIKELIRKRDLHIIDRDTAVTHEEKHRMHLESFSCDYYLMSSNAVTRDGKLVNIDGIGNRVAALIYGPAAVYVIVGVNKICKDEDEALERVRNLTAPKNAIRLKRSTPSAETGFCHDCLKEQCICSHIVVTRRSWTRNRIKIIIINEALGL